MNLDFSFGEGYSRDQMKIIFAQIFTADKSGALTQRPRATTGQLLYHIERAMSHGPCDNEKKK